MLKVKKNITLTGESLIEATAVEGYSAEIDSENPENISISNWQIDKDLYKKNRTQCLQDYAAFMDKAYALQDKGIRRREIWKSETDRRGLFILLKFAPAQKKGERCGGNYNIHTGELGSLALCNLGSNPRGYNSQTENSEEGKQCYSSGSTVLT